MLFKYFNNKFKKLIKLLKKTLINMQSISPQIYIYYYFTNNDVRFLKNNNVKFFD